MTHAGAPHARGADARARRSVRRRMGGAARGHRSGSTCRSRGSPIRSSTASADAAGGRGGDREISWLRLAALSRATAPPGLVARQAQGLGSGIDVGARRPGARFVPAQGMALSRSRHAALAAARAAIPRAGDPWRLGALHSITTLTGSALIALAVLPAGCRPRRPGRRRMSTRTGTWSSGAATMPCAQSGAPTASARCRRPARCC